MSKLYSRAFNFCLKQKLVVDSGGDALARYCSIHVASSLDILAGWLAKDVNLNHLPSQVQDVCKAPVL